MIKKYNDELRVNKENDKRLMYKVLPSTIEKETINYQRKINKETENSQQIPIFQSI